MAPYSPPGGSLPVRAAGRVRINLHHLRFRATAPSVKVTFTDAEAEPETETALNYFMLKPYFDE